MHYYQYTETAKTIAAGSSTAFVLKLDQIPTPPAGYDVCLSNVYVNLQLPSASWSICTTFTALAGNVNIIRIENNSSGRIVTTPLITVIWSYIES